MNVKERNIFKYINEDDAKEKKPLKPGELAKDSEIAKKNYVPSYLKNYWKPDENGQFGDFFKERASATKKGGLINPEKSDCEFWIYTLDKKTTWNKNLKEFIESPDPEGAKSILVCTVNGTPANIEELREIDNDFVEWALKFCEEGDLVIHNFSSYQEYDPAKLNPQDYTAMSRGLTTNKMELRTKIGLPNLPKDVEPQSYQETIRRTLNRYFRFSGGFDHTIDIENTGEIRLMTDLLRGLGFSEIPFRHNFSKTQYFDMANNKNYKVSDNGEIYLNLKNGSFYDNFEQYVAYCFSLLTDDVNVTQENSPNYHNFKRTLNDVYRNYSIDKRITDNQYKLLCITDFTLKGTLENGSYKWNIILKTFRTLKKENNYEINEIKPVIKIEETVEVPFTFNNNENYLKFNYHNFKENEFLKGLEECFRKVVEDLKSIDFGQFLIQSADLSVYETGRGLNESKIKQLYKKYEKYI